MSPQSDSVLSKPLPCLSRGTHSQEGGGPHHREDAAFPTGAERSSIGVRTPHFRLIARALTGVTAATSRVPGTGPRPLPRTASSDLTGTPQDGTLPVVCGRGAEAQRGWVSHRSSHGWRDGAEFAFGQPCPGHSAGRQLGTGVPLH